MTPAEEEYLRLLPKVELHCHFIGSMRPSTAGDLARAHGVSLPAPAEELFARIDTAPLDGEAYRHTALPLPNAADVVRASDAVGLLEASLWISRAIRKPDEFARVVYEAQQDAFEQSTVLYRELFFEAGWFLHAGVTYADMVAGLAAGLEAAETDFGIAGRLIVGLDRSWSPATALRIVEKAVDHPHPAVIGIGLEGSELAGAPGSFAAAYRLAAEHGLRRTAHAGEHFPAASYVLACLDELGCDRIDHGYFVLESDAATARCRDEGVAFTCAFTTSRKSWIPWRRASVARMIEDGLQVCLNSDDPTMFPTTLLNEYLQAHDELGLSLDAITDLASNAVEASWMEETVKTSWRARLDAYSRQQPAVVNGS
jgi:adenosine deaminase